MAQCRVMTQADLALVNGDFAPLAPGVHGVGITGGRISHVWLNSRDVEARETIDCEGGTVLPAIDDSHLHGYEYGRALTAVDVRTEVAPTVEALQRILQNAQPEANGWIRGIGWDSTVLHGSGPDGTISAADLDRACPDHPVILSDMTGHQAVVNSEALRRAGLLGTHGENPPGGVIIRDAVGNPTGLLFEAAVGLLNAVMPPLSLSDKKAAILATQRDLLRQGVVAYTDPGLGPGAATLLEGTGDLEAVRAYQELDAAGDLVLRVNVMLLFGGLGGTTASAVRAGLDAWGTPADMPEFGHLGIAQLKVFADGIPRSRTAWMSEPYDDCTHGHLQVAGSTDDERVAELHDIIQSAGARGWQIGLHTIGDQAIEHVVDAIAAIPEPQRSMRHYIIHGDFVKDKELSRMRDLGMTLNANPSIRWAVGDSVAPLIGEERNLHRQRLRTAWDMGVNVCASSDAPVAPPDWRVMVAAAVTRAWRTQPQRSDDQRLTVAEALTAMTRNAAWQSRAESWRGKLDVGYAADVVVLDRAVDWSDPWSLTDTAVRGTVVDGNVVFGDLGRGETGRA